MVKQVAETKIVASVRVLRDKLYPIKADNINHLAVLDRNREIQSGAIEVLSKKNDTTVTKVAWLSKKNVPKVYRSVVVYLTKESNTRHLLRKGFFYIIRESSYTEVFEEQLQPKQYYNY